MLDAIEIVDPSILLRPYGKCERALGHLAQALETTRLHQTWLWRELARTSVIIAQAGGFQARVDQLRLTLIGAPLDPDHQTSGLAAARRVFLAAAPLFRTQQEADSKSELWPRFWSDEPPTTGNKTQDQETEHVVGDQGAGETERRTLLTLVRDLAGFADDGRWPALINLLVDLRKHVATGQLSPLLVRIALPLALAKTNLVPKPAPGLLGGRRLPLGLSRAVTTEKPLNDWLSQALENLALEADQSFRRLIELERQHQAWHGALASAGLRRHARAPEILNLLAATPVLSIGLVARHLGCSHVAAGQAVRRLVANGILIEQTTRSRHKIFIAGDLPTVIREDRVLERPLVSSAPPLSVDFDAIKATLDGLFADLDLLTERAKTWVRSKG